MMKRKYLSPVVEVVASLLKSRLMNHSYGWADAKGFSSDEQEDGEEVIKSKNLWED